jgi:hypothetical protein
MRRSIEIDVARKTLIHAVLALRNLTKFPVYIIDGRIVFLIHKNAVLCFSSPVLFSETTHVIGLVDAVDNTNRPPLLAMTTTTTTFNKVFGIEDYELYLLSLLVYLLWLMILMFFILN